MVSDPSGEKKPLWQGYTYGDGHCSWSPDKTLVVSDTYPGGENHEYDLFLYQPESNKLKTLVTLPHPKGLPGDCRCDLHARWSRTGNYICFDGAPEGSRQLFTVDLTNFNI
jgi:Tol biopolymer transport system component